MESRYRGEYPNRIKCVWSALRKPTEARAGLFATTNCGAVYRVVWLPSASLPQPGEDIFTFRADIIYKPYNDLAIKLGGL